MIDAEAEPVQCWRIELTLHTVEGLIALRDSLEKNTEFMIFVSVSVAVDKDYIETICNLVDPMRNLAIGFIGGGLSAVQLGRNSGPLIEHFGTIIAVSYLCNHLLRSVSNVLVDWVGECCCMLDMFAKLVDSW